MGERPDDLQEVGSSHGGRDEDLRLLPEERALLVREAAVEQDDLAVPAGQAERVDECDRSEEVVCVADAVDRLLEPSSSSPTSADSRRRRPVPCGPR